MLRTPSAIEGGGGSNSAAMKKAKGRMIMVRDQMADLAVVNGLKTTETIQADAERYDAAGSLLPTPTLGHIRNNDEPIDEYLARRAKGESGEYRGMPGISLGVAVRMETETELLPTPTTQESSGTCRDHGGDLLHEVTCGCPRKERTPLVDDAKNSGQNQTRRATLAGEVWLTQTTTKWGKYEPAIRRWESITRPAPPPTRPDGKDGAHRLNPEFTEWMMGLPKGWITDQGLKRNDELKMAGNGVCPQQAEHAIRNLLADLQEDMGETE
jgi:hypothetical protein